MAFEAAKTELTVSRRITAGLSRCDAGNGRKILRLTAVNADSSQMVEQDGMFVAGTEIYRDSFIIRFDDLPTDFCIFPIEESAGFVSMYDGKTVHAAPGTYRVPDTVCLLPAAEERTIFSEKAVFIHHGAYRQIIGIVRHGKGSAVFDVKFSGTVNGKQPQRFIVAP